MMRFEQPPNGAIRPSLKRTLRRTLVESVGLVLDAGRLQRYFVREVAVVVAFHRVNPRTAGDAISVSPNEFESYCQFFRRHFEVISLRTLLDRLEVGEHIGGTVVITFDDGYEDNIEFAAPILQSWSLPATFFVSTGYVNSKRVAPWDEHITPSPGWMDWDQIRTLRDMGFEIGAHTVNHIDLATTPVTEVRAELLQSRAELEDVLGERIDLFSYPFGGPEHITPQARDLVREAGFRCCPSCHGGLNDSSTDPFHLNRIPINSWFSSRRHLALNLALGRV